MRHQFKAGDLALIVGALQHTQNIGKTCELVQFVRPGEAYTSPDGDLTSHPIDRPGGWVVIGDGITGPRIRGAVRTISVGWGVALEKFLMPLRCDGEPVSETTSEPEAIPA